MNKTRLASLSAAIALALAAPAALAAGTHAGGHGEPASHAGTPAITAPAPAARPGNAARATRTVDMVLGDDMRFAPASLEVKAGETVRFRVRNTGKLRHEMVIGSLHDLKAHAEQMRQHPGMVHAEPNQLSLAPGQRGTLVWRFDRPGQVDFACTEPGHLEAGMVGKVLVTR